MSNHRVSRRAVLLATLSLPLAGCRVRLESDAPSFLGTPSPDPAGPALSSERDRVAAVLAACARIDTPLVARLMPLHRAQIAHLDRALALLDPPLTPAPTNAGGTPAAGAPSPSGPAAVTGDELADLEFAGLDDPGLADLDAVLPRVASVVAASHAQRGVALHLLRPARVRGGDDLPSQPWVAADHDVAVHLVESVRAAAHGLEIAAARTELDRRPPLSLGIERLRAVEAALGANVADLPSRPLGHPLPGPVTTPAEAARLADGVLDRLTADVASLVVPTSVLMRDVDLGAPHPVPPTGAPTPPAGDPAPMDPRGSMGTLVRLMVLADTTRISLGGAVRPLPPFRDRADAARRAPSPATSVLPGVPATRLPTPR